MGTEALPETPQDLNGKSTAAEDVWQAAAADEPSIYDLLNRLGALSLGEVRDFGEGDWYRLSDLARLRYEGLTRHDVDRALRPARIAWVTEQRRAQRLAAQAGAREAHSQTTSEQLGENADDAGNAQFMYELYGERYLYSPALGWQEWTGTHWKAGADASVMRAAIESLRRRRHLAVDARREGIVGATMANGPRVNACVQLFRALVTEPDAEVFDADPDLLNVLNGVLNLRTKSLALHCPRQRFTYVVPVEWNPEADTSAWHNFIHQAVGNNEEVCHFLQRAIGYAFTGHTREEILVYLYGPPRAGKGTLAETIQALLPHPISAAVDFNTFTARRDGDTQNFDLAPLRPARIVFASESNKYQALNPAKIKQLTGGDYVYCAFKHKDHFRYRPQYTVFLLSNHPVNADAEDDALWGRVLVVPFPISHLGSEDKELKERLRRPEHLQGLLRWVVEGAAAWYEGGLQPPAAIGVVTQEQRDAQDYARQWANDCCELRNGAWTTSNELMESWAAWCEANNIKAGAAKDLAASLKRLGCKSDKRQSGRRGFNGIALRVTPEPGHQGGRAPEIREVASRARGNPNNPESGAPGATSDELTPASDGSTPGFSASSVFRDSGATGAATGAPGATSDELISGDASPKPSAHNGHNPTTNARVNTLLAEAETDRKGSEIQTRPLLGGGFSRGSEGSEGELPRIQNQAAAERHSTEENLS